MTPDIRSRRPRARALWALLALVGLLWLSAEPHRHADERDERSCAACQVSRDGGGTLPEPSSAEVLRPEGAPVPTRLVALDVAGLRRHAGPLPSRGPPPVSSSELL